MMSDDPRLARTYAEFPLESLDLLLDRACTYLSQDTVNIDDPLTMVDIGSGLGRIVFYSALTRDSKKANWEIHQRDKKANYCKILPSRACSGQNIVDGDDARRIPASPRNHQSRRTGTVSDPRRRQGT